MSSMSRGVSTQRDEPRTWRGTLRDTRGGPNRESGSAAQACTDKVPTAPIHHRAPERSEVAGVLTLAATGGTHTYRHTKRERGRQP